MRRMRFTAGQWVYLCFMSIVPTIAVLRMWLGTDSWGTRLLITTIMAYGVLTFLMDKVDEWNQPK